MKAQALAILVLALMSAAGAARPSNDQVLGLFNEWNSRLQTLDPERVADMYAPTAVLLPTVSNQVRDTREKIVDYFKYFLANKPVGKIDSYKVRRPASDIAMLMGIYTFTFEAGNSVQARFSYTFKKFGNRWLIIEHHSSAMPENTVAEVAGAFTAWNDALQTRDPAVVAGMYAPNAGVLLPTLSNTVRNTKEEIEDYFVGFLAKGPKGTILNIPGQSPNIRLLAPGVAINSGIYRFDFSADNSTAYARYSYTYVKYGSRWLIADHHSSVMPEPGFTEDNA